MITSEMYDLGVFQTSWEDGGFGRRSRPNPPLYN